MEEIVGESFSAYGSLSFSRVFMQYTAFVMKITSFLLTSHNGYRPYIYSRSISHYDGGSKEWGDRMEEAV